MIQLWLVLVHQITILVSESNFNIVSPRNYILYLLMFIECSTSYVITLHELTLVLYALCSVLIVKSPLEY